MAVITDESWLEVNGVPLATPAWRITDLSALLDSPPTVGSDVRIPRTHGRRPYRRWFDEQMLTFPVDIYGDSDLNGATISDPRQGVIDNLEYLHDNLGIAGASTVAATWYRFDASYATATVTVLGFKGTRDAGVGLLRTTLDIVVPAGRFTVIGS